MERLVVAAVAIFLAITVAGCAQFSLIEPAPTMIGDMYSVTPRIQWNSSKTGKYEIWTVDGLGLQRLQFITGIEDNEALYAGKQYEKIVFKKNMTATEIMDLVAASFAADEARKIETKNFKPYQFGGYSGFKCDLSFVKKEGLEWDGLVLGAVVKGKLHLILYTGTRAHYFPKYRTEVEWIIQSIKM